MSDHVLKSSNGEGAALGTSSQVCQPGWMSHWKNGNLKADESSLICKGDRCADDKSGTLLRRSEIGGFSRFGKQLSKDPENLLLGEGNYEDMGTTSTIRTQVNHEFGNKSVSLALALGREDTSSGLNLLLENNWKSNGKQPVCDSFDGQDGLAFPKSCADDKSGSAFCHGTNHVNASKPVVVLEKFSNDNFTCFAQDKCKYKKYSSFLIHETGMKNRCTDEGRQSNGHHVQHGQSANKNFQALFYKQRGKSGQNHSTARLFPRSLSNIHQGHHGSLPPASISCFRNVETTRICTMVDSVQNSPGGHHKVTQRANHFLFTKETCLNVSNEHQELREPTSFSHSEGKTFEPFHMSPDFVYSKPSGVKIQPLWTSTDSDEQENTGNSSIFKAGSTSRNEESSGVQVEPATKLRSLPGVASSSLHKKDDIVDENSSPVGCDSSIEKTRCKRPLVEIPDINEELPEIQPAASSIDGEETSVSTRVHSLDAKQIFSYGKQSCTNDYTGSQYRSLGPDTNNRWIKRLKLSSSDSFGVGTKSSDGEGSSPKKLSSFFSRDVKGNIDNRTDSSKHYGEVQMTVDENVGSMISRKRNQSAMSGCLWIQRWCQNNTAPIIRNPEPLVICEPHSIKFGQDETTKKHSPSIGALAMMGKGFSGFRSCEVKKRGSVVVWNTKEY